MAISKKVAERLAQQLKKYQSILSEAKDRDVSESDTVVIIADMLADLLGYKKYVEITTEFAIRGTYVDLAVKVGSDVRFLLEAKAIGQSLKDNHVKQAIDYGANHGIEWIVLTNGVVWQVYKIHFRQPIDKSLIFEIDLLQASPKNEQFIECFGNLSREGFTQSSMTAFFQQQQATSKFSIAALLTSEPMLQALRREMRKISGNIKIEDDQLVRILQNDVLKRETVDGEEAKQAKDYLKQAVKQAAKAKAMNHLDDIIAQTKAHGKYEEPWHILDNAFFKGDDQAEKIKQWAASQGLTVTTDSRLRTYIFRVAGNQPK